MSSRNRSRYIIAYLHLSVRYFDSFMAQKLPQPRRISLFFATRKSLTFRFSFRLSQMRLLLFFNSILLLNAVLCEEEIEPRVLNRRSDYEALESIEQQMVQEFSANQTAVEATADDVIEEIIDSRKQGRQIEGLDEIYADPTVQQALSSGDDTQARNLIRDKLCDLGLMECEQRGPPPMRYYYSQPPPGAVYSQRPGNRPPPPRPSANGIYGPARPVPLPGQTIPQQPPRKVGYAPQNYNNFQSSKPLGPIRDKYSTDFYEIDPAPSSIKFGYTEKPTIIVNQGNQGSQGKREANGGVSQNHHVHHHYVHVDGNAPIDVPKTVLVNTPISEYSAVNTLSGSYQTSGFGASGSGSQSGFNPSQTDFEYKGVNSGAAPGFYGGATNAKPVFESSGQYASGTNYYQQQQPQQQLIQPNVGPAVFTDGSNGIYQGGSSFHSQSPDYYKKELNLNGNRGNAVNYQQQQQLLNTQKYSKNQFINGGEQYQGFESARQDQYDCICVPFEQCPAHDVVGRRDDLILPLDPRNLPTEIEADSDHNSTRVTKDTEDKSEVKKVSKRAINDNDDVEKVQGEGVSSQTKKLLNFLSLIVACVDCNENQKTHKTTLLTLETKRLRNCESDDLRRSLTSYNSKPNNTIKPLRTKTVKISNCCLLKCH